MSKGQWRGTNETERARHIASAEVAGFATTAATMLLGLIAGAEARDHGAPPHDPPPASPQWPATGHIPAPPLDPAPPPGHDAPHAAAVTHAPAAAGDASSILPLAPHRAAELHAHAAGSGHTVEPFAPVIAPQAAASLHHVVHQALPASQPPAVATGLDGHQGAAQHPAAALDIAPASLSQIGETLNTTLHQITATLTNDIAHIGSSLSTIATGLTSSLSGLTADVQHVTSTADTLAQHMLADATPHFDTAGAVPLHVVQVQPLQLGFLGQPTADGHDTHDGAFSALGAHHF